MDKISIDNIFSNNADDNLKNDICQIDTDNIFCDYQKKNKSVLDISKIRSQKQMMESLLKDEYKKKYRICVNKINMANECGKRYTIYSMINDAFLIKNFSCRECLLYIDRKLNKQQFDTKIIDDKTILISWTNLYNTI